MVSVKILLTSIFLLSVVVAAIGVYIQYPKQAFASEVLKELSQTQGTEPNVTVILSKINYLEYSISWMNVTTITKLVRNGGSYNLQIYLNNTLIDEIKFTISGNNISNITETVYNTTTGEPKETKQLNQTTLEARLTGRAYDNSVMPGVTLLPPEVIYPLFVFYLPHVTYNETRGYVELTSATPVTIELEGKEMYGLQVDLKPTDIGLQFARSAWDQNEYNITLTKIDGLLVATHISMVNVPQGGYAALNPPIVKLVKISVQE